QRLPDKARGALFTPRGLKLRGDDVDDWLVAGDRIVELAGGKLQRFDLSQDKLVPGAIDASAIGACGSSVVIGRTGAVALIDPATLGVQRELDMDDAVPVSVACSPDGRLVAASGLDGAAHLYELGGGREIAHLPVAGATAVKGLAFSPDGSLLHLRALGSLSSLGSARFVRIGDPARLPPPQQALDQVLLEHGVQLRDGEISALPQSP
ncbi:MAG TPA: hypothetical protein VLW85_23810, partial [Myxococcales bacterium]|nr:hypothetical protein [Myxococcales bacterium]